MHRGEQPASKWPDQAEVSRWANALKHVADRLAEERTVAEASDLTVAGGALWANYGELRIRVAGAGAEVTGQAQLFEEIDFWVGFERRAGPGRVLERDQAVLPRLRNCRPSASGTGQSTMSRWSRDLVGPAA
jgi:hypothetical protein